MADSRPTREQALDALCTLIAYAMGSARNAEPATYDQDHLPPGTRRDAFLRRHRARVRDGVSGWGRSGQGRTVTREAWETDIAAETARSRRRRVTAAPPANDTATSIEHALGIRLHKRTR